jgi:hypothetical protein
LSVYSTKFAAGSQNSGTNSNIFTVPSGHTYVIRQITLGLTSAGPGSCLITEGGFWIASSIGLPTQYESVSFNGRWVMDAGDVMNCDAISGNWTFHVSGYDLT